MKLVIQLETPADNDGRSMVVGLTFKQYVSFYKQSFTRW